MKLSEISLTDLFALKEFFNKSGRIEYIHALGDKMIPTWTPDKEEYYLVSKELDDRLSKIDFKA